MAIYHLQVKTVSRRDGRSSVAAAAYRSGERLRDQRLGIEHDYTRKQGVLEADIMAPEGAPEWVYEREALWNAAEAAEKRCDAKVAREYEIALPHELTPEQRSELVFDYAGWLAERHRVVVDVAIHAPHRDGDQRNHHAHLLTTTREVDGEGLGAKTRALDVSRTSSALIEEAREMWAEYCNDSLARAKVQQQELDHRSYERQGLDKAPTLHMGPEATAMERRGEVSRIGEQNRLIQTLNQAREIAREQFERAKEVLDGLVERVKELGQDVAEGLSEGLRRFQENLEWGRYTGWSERLLEGSQGPPRAFLEAGQNRLSLLEERFAEARDRLDAFRAERDGSEGEERWRAEQRVEWQRPALRQSFAAIAEENPLRATDIALGEWNKFTGRDDAGDREWWTDQIMQLQQVPEVYYAKELEKEQARKVEKTVQQSLDRGRGMGMDIDFD